MRGVCTHIRTASTALIDVSGRANIVIQVGARRVALRQVAARVVASSWPAIMTAVAARRPATSVSQAAVIALVEPLRVAAIAVHCLTICRRWRRWWQRQQGRRWRGRPWQRRRRQWRGRWWSGRWRCTGILATWITKRVFGLATFAIEGAMLRTATAPATEAAARGIACRAAESTATLGMQGAAPI